MDTLAKLLRSKLVVWLLILLPGLWLAWPLWLHPSGAAAADPLKFALHHLGYTACVLLVCSLALTPLRVLAPRQPVALALNRHRRLIGVSAAGYALLHVTAHVLYEGGSDPGALPGILRTAVHKPFQLTGLIAFTILLVLAVTSLHAIVRWLGGRRWKALHRLSYVAAALVAYHFSTSRKIFPRDVLWIFGALAALEVLRIWRQQTGPAKVAPSPGNATPPRSRSG